MLRFPVAGGREDRNKGHGWDEETEEAREMEGRSRRRHEREEH